MGARVLTVIQLKEAQAGKPLNTHPQGKGGLTAVETSYKVLPRF